MRVQDLMDRNYPVIYAGELATKARATLRDRGLRILPVLDEQRHLVGALSRADIMAITSSISPIRVGGIMSTPKFVATLDMDAFNTVQKMVRLDEWYVPVVRSPQDSTYTGMFSLEGFIKASLKRETTALSKPLSQFMATELITCSPSDEVDDVWRLMRERSFAGLPVVKRGRLIGVVTQKDLLDSGGVFPTFEAKKGRFKTPPKMSSVMKTSVASLKPTDTVRKAAELMLEKNIGRIPIVNNEGKLVGMVDREDIARALL